ncbi:uncharacterized protein LOC119727075 [Patiria miniata]|uniref:Amine oxidase domain-containing protein n=1 Tax=Patiria miniata TaxID=46514 RepID=A0A913ZTE4_PATMI|nr:uncharacterized protein LOC119727075 [Patiria miniata]
MAFRSRLSGTLSFLICVGLYLSLFNRPLDAKGAASKQVSDLTQDGEQLDKSHAENAAESSLGGAEADNRRVTRRQYSATFDWYQWFLDKELVNPGNFGGYCEVDHHQVRRMVKPRKIVIIGSGPTGLGAAQRLYDLRQEDNNTVITILEKEGKPGGLASSERDEMGFLWDVGVHVVFSHYTYFDRVLNLAVPEWNYRRRASFAFMKGSDGIRRFIPYPVQNNIHTMDKVDQQRSLAGLEEITRNPISGKPVNFDEWMLQKFGVGLADVFMRKYNRKIWTVDTKEMNSAWVGERVAVPDIEEIKTKIDEVDSGANAKDSEWGPNRFFRYPKYNGTGGMWESVARRIPRRWFNFHSKVIGIDVDRKEITVEVGKDAKHLETIEYDSVISTVPLDVFTGFIRSSDESLKEMQQLASQLVHTHTHVVSVGLAGQLPASLADKSWVYFPDSDSPFYRLTMFSNYSDDHVPNPAAYWSLMCEIAEPEVSPNPGYWTRGNLIKASIKALVLYGFATADMVVSIHYRRLEHGYPVPSLRRDMILDTVQPWLQSKDIYSRGRFGGWRYEVANQDHSFMQGVEAADKIVLSVPELSYPDPNLANSKKNTDRVVPLDWEIVIAQDDHQDLEWLKPYADHTLVYHLGTDLGPLIQFYAWQRLEGTRRKAQVFLHHITTNYDQLAEVTIFAQGDQEKSRCFKCFGNPQEFLSSARKAVSCEWRDCLDSDLGAADEFPQCSQDKKNGTEILGILNRNCWGSVRQGTGFSHCWDGCFGATKEMIRRHSLESYRQASTYLGTISKDDEDHYLETLWHQMLS